MCSFVFFALSCRFCSIFLCVYCCVAYCIAFALCCFFSFVWFVLFYVFVFNKNKILRVLCLLFKPVFVVFIFEPAPVLNAFTLETYKKINVFTFATDVNSGKSFSCFHVGAHVFKLEKPFSFWRSMYSFWRPMFSRSCFHVEAAPVVCGGGGGRGDDDDDNENRTESVRIVLFPNSVLLKGSSSGQRECLWCAYGAPARCRPKGRR